MNRMDSLLAELLDDLISISVLCSWSIVQSVDSAVLRWAGYWVSRLYFYHSDYNTIIFVVSVSLPTCMETKPHVLGDFFSTVFFPGRPLVWLQPYGQPVTSPFPQTLGHLWRHTTNLYREFVDSVILKIFLLFVTLNINECAASETRASERKTLCGTQ